MISACTARHFFWITKPTCCASGTAERKNPMRRGESVTQRAGTVKFALRWSDKVKTHAPDYKIRRVHFVKRGQHEKNNASHHGCRNGQPLQGGSNRSSRLIRKDISSSTFSLFDAWRAGFRDVVFIIKREMEAEFQECIGDRKERYFHVSYVYQDLDRLPEGIEAPEGRTKPWGTGHALACCKGVVNGPFAIINADDFYGRTAFSEIYDFLAAQTDESKYAMVGYRLKNTVTEFGSVARGVCEIEDGC